MQNSRLPRSARPKGEYGEELPDRGVVAAAAAAPRNPVPQTCTNALCAHRRCEKCYDLDFIWRIISHSNGTPVRDEEWLDEGKGWGLYWWK